MKFAKKAKVEKKICKRCGLSKDKKVFGKHAKAFDGCQPYCNTCRSDIGKEMAKARKKIANKVPVGNGKTVLPVQKAKVEVVEKTKACSGPCRKILPVSAFYVNNKDKSGRQKMCKVCFDARYGRIKESRKDKVIADPPKVVNPKVVINSLQAASSVIAEKKFDEYEKKGVVAECLRQREERLTTSPTHKQYAFVFQNAKEMLSADVTDADIGKLAVQADTNTIWMLERISPIAYTRIAYTRTITVTERLEEGARRFVQPEMDVALL